MQDVIQLGGDDVSQSDGILSKGGDQGEALFDVDNSTAAFEALERDFQEVRPDTRPSRRIIWCFPDLETLNRLSL
jgi:hypothetical protein